MQGEAAPAFPAAATGCPARLPRRATLRRAWPAARPPPPPAHLREFVAQENSAGRATTRHRYLKLERSFHLREV